MITESKLYNIGSQSGTKLNGTKLSYMEYFIPNFIKNDDDDNVKCIYLSIKNAEFPHSFYLINEYNNVLCLSVLGVDTIYTLTQGNYNINNFITSLSSLLGVNYTITFDKITYKITISNSVNFFVILYEKTTMNRFLGISNTENTSSILQSVVYSIISPFVVNFLPIQKLHLRSNTLKVESYNNYDKSNDILLSIQNDTSFGGAIYFNNITNLRYLIDIKNLTNCDLRITDDKNRELDFNNCNWYLTFQIDYVYNEVPIKSNLMNFLKNDTFIKNYIESLTKENYDEE